MEIKNKIELTKKIEDLLNVAGDRIEYGSNSCRVTFGSWEKTIDFPDLLKLGCVITAYNSPLLIEVNREGSTFTTIDGEEESSEEYSVEYGLEWVYRRMGDVYVYLPEDE